MKFEKLQTGKINEIETTITENWKKMNILERSIETRKDKEAWVFYDGPIYANAKPGIHHVFAKSIKDAFCKYKTMQGYKVLRKIGLDTHGLPIEVNVEKKLGFKSKADIENFGVENFCKECNKETASNISEVKKVTDMMGQFIDCENPYVTCDNDYIESEWWIFKEMDKKGLVYHGNKVLPYCPRCGTELSSNEVAQGYQETSVNTVYVPFKIKDEDVYFLVWTTTPWTLMANLGLCVNPDLTYVKVESQGYKFIVCESLKDSVVGEEAKVLEKYKGTDLVGIKYEQLLPFVKVEGRAFEVVADNYVTDIDGTGIVHLAPAYGEDDNRVCRENKFTFINPVDKDGKYTEGPWKGTIVTDKDLEIEIIKYLKENDKLFKKLKITHDYPHCWRCKKPLIYYAKPAWYVETTKCKKEIIEANNKIKWYPDFVGTKRFSNWLENMVDWGVSRNRYWGCPMPIWQCECGHRETIGSRSELAEKLVEDIDVYKLELHRPYVDDLHLKCPKCGKNMERVKDVMDVWFDSGAMPYAQFHYPFENKELFESQFPADFIAEGVDQTRGWFYVLLVISTIISGKSSFKNVVVNDMMLDQYGKKMSKSVGNIINPVEIMEEFGADTIRFYMAYVSPVWTPLKFSVDGVKEVYSKYTSTLKNAYSFFEMYANADGVDPREYNIPVKERELIDRWLLSKLNKLVEDVTAAYEEFDINKVARLVVPFLNDDLSNWYIRSNRRRFWDSELNESKKAVYLTTYEVLTTLCKLCAPLTPFLTEEIYQKLTNEESVHLADFPKANKNLIDKKVEEKMDLVRDICSIGRDARETANIKVRQPIKDIILDNNVKKTIGDLDSIIKEELNVKEIIYKDDMTDYLTYSIKPNFKVLGKELGSSIKLLQEKLTSLTSEDAYKAYNSSLEIELDNKNVILNKDNTILSTNVKEGYTASSSDKVVVVLDTTLTNELILEGLAREMVRTIQSLRKEADFIITDHIKVYYQGDTEIDNMLTSYKDYVQNETLSNEIIKQDVNSEEYDLNGHNVKIVVEKV
ncbi:MAG: isoleucine--tRNA ligase [Bacilli bacterium]|nr:isoleucine--tRNA ligase [Bacilli bacterium]